jgi:inorganic pyrophosphatase
MKTDLTRLATWTEDDNLRVVVESPRGCSAKLRYNPELDVFEYGRSLPLGLAYPYCWGFLPGTVGDDGDPLDVFLITDAQAFPGIVIASRLIGVVQIEQTGEKRRERNDRLIGVPAMEPRTADAWRTPADLSARMREEIEQFFVSATFFTEKDPSVLGWKGPKEALKLVRKGMRDAKSG